MSDTRHHPAPSTLNRLARVLAMAVALLAGCASTTIDTTGQQPANPPCLEGRTVTMTVYWATEWRADQKEPAMREAAALRGIQDFLAGTGCIQAVTVNRLPTEQARATDEELVRLSSQSPVKPDQVLVIVVKELGPRLRVGIPVILEGGTEVLVDVRLIDTTTSQRLAASRTLWRHGGKFVIKGVTTLDHDMSAALRAALRFDPARP